MQQSRAGLGSRVVELRPGGARPRRLDSPLVGRAQQLEGLSRVLVAAEADRACHLVTVLGGAGVGKSRLVEEFIDGLGDRASVLRGRCLPYGEGITYWPLGEIVRDLIDVDEDGQGAALREAIGEQLGEEPKAEQIVTVLAEAVGLGGAGLGTSEKIFWAARRLFEALARPRPLVVVLDDLQWAEPTFLDLVEHVADLSRDAPIVLLCMARAELLEQRPGWSGGKLNATSILLEPLAPDESRELVANLLSRGSLPSDEAGRIADACEGNPLFVEELLAMLIDDRLLQKDDGHWTLVEAPGELPGAADDPRPARRAPGAAPRGGAGAARADLGRGHGVPPRGGARARAALAGAGGGPQPHGARPQGRDPAGSLELPRRRRLPVPPHADPRRGLPLAAQGGAGGPSRALRRLARASGRAASARVRGDPRLPPRAGTPLLGRARPARRPRPGARGARE